MLRPGINATRRSAILARIVGGIFAAREAHAIELKPKRNLARMTNFTATIQGPIEAISDSPGVSRAMSRAGFRKVRIAWSVLWGVAAVLLVALWVRSYWVQDRVFVPFGGP